MLAQTHAFVSASKMEVQSLAIIEALASGSPVIGLGNETVDELVDETNGVRLPNDTSAEEFAAAIRSVCDDRQRRTQNCVTMLMPGVCTGLVLCDGETIQSYETVLHFNQTGIQYQGSGFTDSLLRPFPAGDCEMRLSSWRHICQGCPRKDLPCRSKP